MTFHYNGILRAGRRHRPADPELTGYMSTLMKRFSQDYERRRREELATFELTPRIGFDDELTILKVDEIEFYAEQNAKEHHTEKFELVQDTPKTPVLRRGQHFFIAIKFDGPVVLGKDVIRLVFHYGPKPSINKGTRAILEVVQKENLDEDKWDAKVHAVNKDILSLEINIPVSSPVGLWNVNVHTGTAGVTSFKNYKCKTDIYVLFNPWCEEDEVYMENEAERQEYVLNDSGKIWMGSYLKPKGRRWFYGQFDDVALPVAIHLLEKSGLKHGKRGSAIEMSRAISAVINSEDEDGLIEGRWLGDFAGGISPFAWTGTIAIMEKYLKNKGSPVKYGQCWVFSGAAVTICRALGIPARPVTNYASAHDTNESLTLDKYFTRDGNEIEGGPDGDCYDSCWNFHVWVDVWMRRSDLPAEFSGWQVIDSTPQELSDNAYKCGPASIAAIRRGEVGYLYDTPFAFAAVNADILHFQEDDESTWGFSRLNFDDCHVGKKLVTKRVGVDDDDEYSLADMEDVTNLYKNPEGTASERVAVFNAIRGIRKARLQYDIAMPHEEDVVFRLKEIASIDYGQPFKVVVDMENKSNEPRTIRATMAANSVYYTGTTAHVLKKASGKITLKPKQTEIMHITINPVEYLDKLVDHNLIKLYTIASVLETKQNWSKEDDFSFTKPSIGVSVTGVVRVGSPVSVTFTFKNPVGRRLTACTFSVEGPGLQRPKFIEFRDIEPEEVVTFTEKFVPKRSGSRKIMASFNSKLLSGVTGATTVTVVER